MQPLAALPPWKRAVVKIGSSLIAPEGRRLSVQHVLAVAAFIGRAQREGREVVLVSSGAVAAGRALLADADASTIPARQALAAIGQPRLMALWAELFDRPCAQVLLGRDDLDNRRRFVNAKNTLRNLLALGTLPIINENDSVAVDELRVGDNDNLAAHVAVLVEADLLVILSDVAGLYDRDPRRHPDARLLARVERIDDTVLALAGGAGSSVGTGGMRTKLEAARKAAQRGIATVIAAGTDPATCTALAQGLCPGTLFVPEATGLSSRAHWLRHAVAAQGAILVDAGAARALTERGASLLPAGIRGVDGQFRAGDAVDVAVDDGDARRVIARGLVQYDHGEVRRLAGHASHEVASILGYAGADTVMHRDDLVLL